MILNGGIKKSSVAFMDYFLPRFCVSCTSKLNLDENVICNECFSKIELATQDRITHEYKRKFKDHNIISDFFSLYIFEKDKELQHTIHALKYNNNFRAGIFLGEKLGDALYKAQVNWKIDLIIPIPLHQLKKAERGYNQSFYIAKGVNNSLHKTVSEKIVSRIKYTQSQTTMNINERKENISGAFKIRNNKLIREKNILLIDDVITTGATISECGIILKNAGANNIYAASIAIAN